MKLKRMIASVVCAAAIGLCGAVTAFAADDELTSIISITTREDCKKIINAYRGADKYDEANRQVTISDNTLALKSNDGGSGTVTESATGNKSDICLDKTYNLYYASGSASAIEIKYNAKEYEEKTETEQRKATREMLATVASWGLSQDANNRFAANLERNAAINYSKADAVAALFNQGADITGALAWFSPFSGPLGMILGIGCIVVMALLLFSTVMDLIYIGVPTIRNLAKGSGGKGDGMNGGEKAVPFFISSDAYRIVEEHVANDLGGGGGGGGSTRSGSSMYLEYLKCRILTYIILAVCILYLVSGQIGSLIGDMLDMASGIGG